MAVVRERESIDAKAEEAAAILGIDAIVSPRGGSDGIFEHFVECEELAQKESTVKKADEAFFSVALPVAGALIHYATTLNRFNQAQAWVPQNWHRGPANADPVSVLGLLTLIYVVNAGVKRARKAQDKALWRSMQQRVERLTA